jgi:hypothetical protein
VRRLRLLGVPGAVALSTALCAGCGSQPAAVRASASSPGAAPALSLAGSEATGQAAWAELPMGADSGPNQFWQLFGRTGAGSWVLATPPDVATNAAPALAGLSGASLVAGLRPSEHLAFSPVTRTSDGGQHWSAGPPAQALAGVPDALAATAGGGHLLALSRSGQVSSATSSASAGWMKVVTVRALAATAAGRRCGLLRLTAVAYSRSADPMVAGDCARPGVAGIFERAGAAWHAAGPSLPASVASDRLQVLRLLTSTSGSTALLQADGRSGSELIAAWQSEDGRWSVSPALNLSESALRTTAFGPAGSVAVVLSGGRAAILAGPGGAWRQPPRLPAGRDVTIALADRGHAYALAPAAGTLTIWRLAGGSWVKAQTIKVPIQYGSSS